MKKNSLTAPILKWVGGKRQLLAEIQKYIPANFSTYYEPFVGGAALLFHLQPPKAVINDINSDLISLYQVIKDDVETLITSLSKHRNEPEYFYTIRELDRDKETYASLSPVERASRVIYLNKTCYNGLFRVNKSGEFNAPFGNYKKPNIINEEALRAVNQYFSQAKIDFRNCDFEEALKGIKKGSFVYFDPPYDPASTSSNFTGYNKGGFDRQEQLRLKKLCDQLNRRGIHFLLSNSATDFVKELYQDYQVEIIQARRAINSKGNLRGEVNEVLVRNFAWQ